MKIKSEWKWAAKGEKCGWILCKDKPLLIDFAACWMDTPEECGDYVALPDFIVMPDCDWRDSLHMVVDGELVKADTGKKSLFQQLARECPWFSLTGICVAGQRVCGEDQCAIKYWQKNG